MKKPLVVLTGPTAVGKTDASIGLAKALGGEIISADSMQVYQYMDIGSAKVRPEEMEGIPHFLVDELKPWEEFHVVRFKQMAKAAMEGIYARGHIPIVVGGTGFYIQALLYDIDFSENDGDDSYRRELEQIAGRQGKTALHERLRAVDPASALQIHENNVKRVIRALESPYRFVYFVLNDDRKRLYERIDSRVDRMLEVGLVDEVAALRDMGCKRDMVSMQGLGYKEIFAYLDGELSLEEAIYRLKRDTRHFAKRQITWFKREREVIWINKDEYGYDEDRILCDMIRYVRGELG